MSFIIICFYFIFLFYFIFYCSGFCHTLKWNSHGFTCVPHPDPLSHLPLHPIPLGLPSAPGPRKKGRHGPRSFSGMSFIIIYLFSIGGQLLYNIVLVSPTHPHESALGVQKSPPSWISLPPHPTPLGFKIRCMMPSPAIPRPRDSELICPRCLMGCCFGELDLSMSREEWRFLYRGAAEVLTTEGRADQSLWEEIRNPRGHWSPGYWNQSLEPWETEPQKIAENTTVYTAPL